MTSTPLTLTEGHPGRLRQLTVSEYEELSHLAIVDVRPTLEMGWYEISAGKKIGAVSVGSLEVIVRPKITDLNRLIFLLGYSGHRDLWRDDHIRLTEADDLLPALAEAFSRIATRATDQGLLQDYRTVNDTLPVLRGRMLAGEQMTRRYGLPIPVAVEYDDFTVDTPENRLLLAATLRMLSVPRISATARRRLLRLRVALADVTKPARGTALPTWQATRLNARYHPALHLAGIVMSAQSFEQHAGDLSVSGFMFDMWRVFEDFVCAALSESLGGRTATQYGISLDDADRVTMRPDLIWFDGQRRVCAVIDAKYKAERPEGFPYADLYQLLAYCTATGLQHGHLVYAKGNEPSRTHVVREAGVTIHCHTVDLSASPAELLERVEQIGATVRRLA
ncbi:McrC family protein [Gordonia sp. HY285]|uniref:McrC family protein n=1 Tax=Gordonia liuliyuniae TaxID=2911517 RepID=UPI001F2257FF|nr:McrC family protein [Gordonia liuliyuniae]MCF8608904.1 McrC family protein [Gordonia liuliyuniae]